MSTIQMLRSLVNERLTVAAEEIFGVFERAIEQYGGEINRQRQLLYTMEAEMNTYKTYSFVKSKDPPQLSVCEEEVPPEQQEWSPRLGQEEEPEPLQIKEEQEELWTDREGEQLHGLEEADIITFTSIPAPVKSEHDVEKLPSSWFSQTQTEPLAGTSTEQMTTEATGEDCGLSAPAYNLDTPGDFEPTGDVLLLSSDCSGAETDDSNAWDETSEPRSGLNSLKKTQRNKGQQRSSFGNKSMMGSVGPSHEVTSSNQMLSETWSCKVCGKGFPSKLSLVHHVRVHASDCGLCGKHLEPRESLKLHLQTHSTCTVCGKRFTNTSDLARHMRSHTGEKPYSCTLCHKRFGEKYKLTIHMRSHTGDKPYSCTLCHKRFGKKGNLTRHMRSHTGDKPYSCRLCHKRFNQKANLTTHLKRHIGDEPYGRT